MHAPATPIWDLILRLTDATLRALAFTQEGQRDYPDDTVRGLSIRVGKHTETFMLLIRNGPNRSRVKFGTYPATSLSCVRGLARDRLAAARIARSDLPSIEFEDALDTSYRIHGREQRESTRIRYQYLMGHVKPEYIMGDLIVWPPSAMKEGHPHSLPLMPMVAKLATAATFFTENGRPVC